MNTRVNPDAETQRFVDQLRELVNSAQNQLSLAETAHNDANDRDLASAHRGIGGVLRSMQRVFDTWGKAGAKAGSDANKKVGTSEGITQGVSSPPSPPRAGSPLLVGDIPGWLARASAASGRKRKA